MCVCMYVRIIHRSNSWILVNIRYIRWRRKILCSTLQSPDMYTSTCISDEPVGVTGTMGRVKRVYPVLLVTSQYHTGGLCTQTDEIRVVNFEGCPLGKPIGDPTRIPTTGCPGKERGTDPRDGVYTREVHTVHGRS